MSKAKAIAILASVLGNDPKRLAKFAEELNRATDVELTVAQLSGIVPEGREYLVFGELISAGVFGNVEQLGAEMKGRIDPNGLAWLLDHLNIYVEANAISSTVSSIPMPELAWTLPSGFEITGGPHPRSLAALMSSVISKAYHRLYILSPFLDQLGAEVLAGPVGGAARRGATIYLISHGLDDVTSPRAAALRTFRSVAPGLQAYSAPWPRRGRSNILHAKIIVADANQAVMASANITGYGLSTHLEVGLGLTDKIAGDLEVLLSRLIASELVRRV